MEAGSPVGAVSTRRGEHFPPLKHIHEAVITVPAYFTPAQRAATIEAGKAAGLKRVSLLQEPVAAAMAYGYGTSLLNKDDPVAADKYDTLLVFDLGGGTFDVSVLEGFEGILEVLSTDGDAELGGDDYTRALAGLALHKARLHSSSSSSSSNPHPCSNPCRHQNLCLRRCHSSRSSS
uniref:Uncharacterized protein n=1 Tax=Dunaliella tertiolecta TaxID=3047 RepID=A0A7S3VPL5_DUNTE